MREKPAKVFLTFDVEGPAPYEDLIEERTLFILTTILKKLRKNKLKAIFFLPGSVAKTLSNYDELIELLRPHEIGYHSTTHSIRPLIFEYTDVPDHEKAFKISLERETASIHPVTGKNVGEGGLLLLKKIFPEKQIVSFRAPFMCWSPPHLEALKSLGISYDFSSSVNDAPFCYKGITFFPPPLPLDEIPNVVGFWGKTVPKENQNGFQLNLLISKLLRSPCTVLLMHPARLIFKVQKCYLTKNCKNNPRKPLDVAVRLLVIDVLFKQLNILQKMRMIEVTPPLEMTKKSSLNFDVKEIYARNIHVAKKLFRYNPRFLISHFEEFFNSNAHVRHERNVFGAKYINKIQEEILWRIEAQIKRKIAMKKGHRKRLKVILERMLLKVLRRIFSLSNIEIKRYLGNSSLGCDELGRDVEDGMHQYIKLLKNRKLQIHTVIVLGSRAKGTWTPQSDVDVTIIASNLPKKGRNLLVKRLFGLRKKLILSDRPLYLGIEPSGCCSKAEFLERLERFDIQVLDAVFYGRIIYDDGFWLTLKTKYKKMEKKYGLEQIPLKKMLAAA